MKERDINRRKTGESDKITEKSKNFRQYSKVKRLPRETEIKMSEINERNLEDHNA